MLAFRHHASGGAPPGACRATLPKLALGEGRFLLIVPT